jgi:hypothetical protein
MSKRNESALLCVEKLSKLLETAMIRKGYKFYQYVMEAKSSNRAIAINTLFD